MLDNSLFQESVSSDRSFERMMQLGVLNIKLGSMQRRNSTQRTERTAGSGRVVCKQRNGKASGKGRPKRSRPSAFSRSSIRSGRDRPGVDSKVSHKIADPKRCSCTVSPRVSKTQLTRQGDASPPAQGHAKTGKGRLRWRISVVTGVN